MGYSEEQEQNSPAMFSEEEYHAGGPYAEEGYAQPMYSEEEYHAGGPYAEEGYTQPMYSEEEYHAGRPVDDVQPARKLSHSKAEHRGAQPSYDKNDDIIYRAKESAYSPRQIKTSYHACN